MFCIIFSAIEIQCDYLYDSNKKDTVLSQCDVKAELGSKQATNKTAFLIKNSLRLSRMLRFFYFIFRNILRVQIIVSFIKMVKC